jgi:hypothetical protein
MRPVSSGEAIRLEKIATEQLFALDEDVDNWCKKQFKEWRDLYLAADENNEEILVKFI